MKEFILGMFKLTSNKTNYKTELIYIAIGLLIIILEFGLSDLFNNDTAIMIRAIVLLKFLFFLFLSFNRFLWISDNKNKLKFKEGNFNFKYDSCMYSINDIFVWLEKAVEPDTILVKSNRKQIHVIDIQFEVKGRVGPFINKGIFFNEEEFDVEGIKKIILDECLIIDDKLEVLFYTENNDPKLFQKVIDQLK